MSEYQEFINYLIDCIDTIPDRSKKIAMYKAFYEIMLVNYFSTEEDFDKSAEKLRRKYEIQSRR